MKNIGLWNFMFYEEVNLAPGQSKTYTFSRPALAVFLIGFGYSGAKLITCGYGHFKEFGDSFNININVTGYELTLTSNYDKPVAVIVQRLV